MKLTKYSFILAIFSMLIFSSCEKNFPDGGAYQEPAFLKIVGPTTSAKNSERTYYTYYLDNGNYVWSFPADATITPKPEEGQGKSRVTIKFGVTSGKVTVKAKGMEASINVTVQ